MVLRTLKLFAICAAVAVGCTPFEPEPDDTAEEPFESDWEPMRTVPGEPLDDDEIERFLARLPSLDEDAGEEVEFHRRPESPPPPLSGEDIEGEWPPDMTAATAETSPDGPLKAQAFRPKEQVEPPFQIAIGFDRPVVDVGAVGTHDDPPARLAPEIDGRWRWLGTRTVVFEPENRWPMATEYSVELQRDLEAVDGTSLDSDLRFEFTTPPPQIQKIIPGTSDQSESNPQAADAPVGVVFNQPMNQESSEAIAVTEQLDDDVRAIEMRRLGTDERREFAEDHGIEEADDEKRLIAMAPQQDYRTESEVTVEVSGPVQSKDGPIPGTPNIREQFDVRGPMKVIDVQCQSNYREETCRPSNPVEIVFSNPPADDNDTEVEITARPHVGELDVRQRDSTVLVWGQFEPHTTYELQVSEKTVDRFGQTITDERTGEFATDGHRPDLDGPDSMVVIRPTGLSPEFSVSSIGVNEFRVRFFAADTESWTPFRRYRQRKDDHLDLELIDTRTVEIPEGTHSGRIEHQIDASSALDATDTNQIVVVIDEVAPGERRRRTRHAYWLQHTDLSVDINHDGRTAKLVATRLSDGSEVKNARIELGTTPLTTTDITGEATFEIPGEEDKKKMLSIRSDGDRLLIHPRGRIGRMGEYQWDRRDIDTSTMWYVVDDRQMYRPGERVHLRGWVRTREDTPRSDPKTNPRHSEVRYRVLGPRRNEITDGTLRLDDTGGFEFDLYIPEEIHLGRARIQFQTNLERNQHGHLHTFHIQEFRRPEFEVSAETSEGPHLARGDVDWTVTANYYAGGEVSDAPVIWRFSESPANYRPSGWRGWSFGKWTRWWWSSDDDDDDRQLLSESFEEPIEATTDTQGRHEVAMPLGTPDRGFARSVDATVSVEDVDRQSWEATDQVLVHPADVYVGLNAERNFIRRGGELNLEAIAVDIDGDLIEDKAVDIQLKRRTGRDEYTDAGSCRITSAEQPRSCSFAELRPGSYRAVASAEDGAGRTSETELNLWVSGHSVAGSETAEQDELRLVPDRDEYAPGDTAEVFVQAPYYPMEAVVELGRDGSYDYHRVTLTDDDPIVEIDVEEAMIPNVHVEVTALSAGDEYAADRFAGGSLNLPVSAASRTLDIDITPPDDSPAPGEEAEFTARVTDVDGDPVEGTRLLMFGVDEAILAMSDYELADPIEAFYPDRDSSLSAIRSREWLFLDDDVDEQDARGGRTGTEGLEVARYGGVDPDVVREAAPFAFSDDEPDAIELREIFDALAFFRTDLTTDEDGTVRITEQMPDTLTRYRVMAVAVQGDKHFGSGEADTTVQKPLMVSPSAPRFLNVGDQFDFPVVVHNQTDEPKEVTVGLRSNKHIRFTEPQARRIRLPADDRIEIRFAARAVSAGDAQIQVAVSDDEYDDAELAEFPVLTPATTEAFGTYGTIDADDDDAVLEAVRAPENAYADYGGLDVSASSTQLHALTDAYIYLLDYPFTSAPHLASQILSILALNDVFEAFETGEALHSVELQRTLERWTEKLLHTQRSDGGFGFWKNSRSSHPYVSTHATSALAALQYRQDVDVPDEVLQNALDYLENMPANIDGYGDRIAAAIEAYALHVRNEVDSVSDREVEEVITRYGIEEMPLEALGWMLPLVEGTQFADRFDERIQNQVQETATAAEFQETYGDGAHRLLHTDRRTDGVVLDGLLRTQPDHRLIDKVVRGLMGNKTRGRWANTQENTFIILALRRYFDVHEETSPDFIARAWLGDDHIAEHAFEGHNAERYSTQVPMRFLKENGDSSLPVVFKRDGTGRMYYRLGMKYAPTSRQLAAVDEGFSVDRNYEPIDDPDDVRRTDDGWEIAAGARVRVELSMTVPARRNHVALVDWLPAGFEPLNPALAVTDVEDELTGASRTRSKWGWWGWPWYNHENLRDERVEAFATQVSEGVHTYSYVARATTPGQFVAMPAKAEEMYHPETFGRSSTEVVTVVDP